MIAVPTLIGRSEEEATIMLIEAGLRAGRVSETTSEDEALLGLVCYQSVSAGVFVEAGTIIDFHISTGITGALYSYIDSIGAPTYEEDPHFKLGTNVQVLIKTTDEVQLMDAYTTSFPVLANFSNIRSAHGFIYLRYVNHFDAYTIYHEDGTEEVIAERKVSEQIIRPVDFIQIN